MVLQFTVFQPIPAVFSLVDRGEVAKTRARWCKISCARFERHSRQVATSEPAIPTLNHTEAFGSVLNVEDQHGQISRFRNHRNLDGSLNGRQKREDLYL